MFYLEDLTLLVKTEINNKGNLSYTYTDGASYKCNSNRAAYKPEIYSELGINPNKELWLIYTKEILDIDKGDRVSVNAVVYEVVDSINFDKLSLSNNTKIYGVKEV